MLELAELADLHQTGDARHVDVMGARVVQAQRAAAGRKKVKKCKRDCEWTAGN